MRGRGLTSQVRSIRVRMLEELDTYIGGFRFASIVEIALVAAIFFVLFSWFRQSITGRASRNAFIAIFLYAMIYLASRLFDLYFLQLLLESSLVLFFLALIVTFQTEIRRLIDRIGTLRIFGRGNAEAADASLVDTVTEAAYAMAERNIGALIAIKGRESWDGHIEGGVELDGYVSPPLLYSLFDPDSAGHDGAALIEGDRLTRFGVHLPLSAHRPEASRFGGTRHAAAQGLSELTDALVVVVSEERGKVSIAEGGDLHVVEEPGELRKRLDAFWALHYAPASNQRKARTAEHLKVGLLSVVLAFVLWLSFTAYQPGTVFRTYTVPIELGGIPEDAWTNGPVPAQARIILSGSSGAFRLLDPAALLISINLDEIEYGSNEVRITEENVEAPPNVNVYDIDPEVITVDVQRMVQRTLPIEVRVTGALPDSLVLRGFRLAPDSLRVMAPEGDYEAHSTLALTVDLSQVEGPVELTRRLDLPPRWRVPPGATTDITVAIDVAPRTPAN